LPIQPNEFHQKAAPYASDEGVKTLAELCVTRQGVRDARIEDVATRDKDINTLGDAHRRLNDASVKASADFHGASIRLMDAMVDGDDASYQLIVAEHNALRLMRDVSTNALQYLVGYRMQKAEVEKIRAQVAAQLARAELSEAEALLLTAKKLKLLGPLFDAEGESLQVQGGVSDIAIAQCSYEFERYANLCESLRAAEARFAAIQQSQR
jgi:hypothetical protein